MLTTLHQHTFRYDNEYKFPGRRLERIYGSVPKDLNGCIFMRKGGGNANETTIQKMTFYSDEVWYQSRKVKLPFTCRQDDKMMYWNDNIILVTMGKSYVIDQKDMSVLGTFMSTPLGVNPKLDITTNRLVVCRTRFSSGTTHVHVVEYVSDNIVHSEHVADVNGFVNMSDFALTPNYVVAIDNQLGQSAARMVVIDRKNGRVRCIPLYMTGIACTHLAAVEDTQCQSIRADVLWYNIHTRQRSVTTFTCSLVLNALDNVVQGCDLSVSPAVVDPCDTYVYGAGRHIPQDKGLWNHGLCKYDPCSRKVRLLVQPRWIFGEPFVMENHIVATSYDFVKRASHLVIASKESMNADALFRFESPVSMGTQGVLVSKSKF
jgi:hypothetical protein